MFGKLKILLKWLLILFVVIVIAFGLYRREYLSQAIPVYMQYLEQRSKWEKVNTGTYVYFLLENRGYYLFVQNNELVKVGIYGNNFQLKYLQGKMYVKQIQKHRTWNERFYGFSGDKTYLIDEQFEKIKYIFWEGLKENLFFWKTRERHTYKIGYDFKFAYPKMVIVDLENDRGKQVTCSVEYPHNLFVANDLIMLPKGTKFTKKLLKVILKKYETIYFKRLHNKTYENLTLTHEVGGNLIKSAILKTTEKEDENGSK